MQAGSHPRNCALIALAAVLAVLAWQALAVRYVFGGNWTALFCTGGLLKVPPELAAGTYRFPRSYGYDGQFYRYVAHDPFFSKGYARYIDNPQFRYRRILAPAAAWALALGNDRLIDGAIDAVVLLSIFLGVYWCGRWAALRGRAAAWGLVFLLLPAAVTSWDRMLTDATLAACFAGFVWYSESGKLWGVWAVSAAAFLTRDTGVLLIAAAVAACVLRKAWRQAAWFATAAVPALAWYGFVRMHAGGVTPWGAIAWPWVGIARQFLVVRHYGDPLIEKVLQALDVVALAGLAAAIVAALWIVRRQKAGPVEICVVLFAATGMCFGAPVLAEAYSFGRAISPLLLFLLLEGARGRRAALVPPLMTLTSVGIMSVSPAWRIVQGIAGLR